MGKKTLITWCDHTFCPWWGCVKVSEGCDHCYAEAFAHRRLGLPIWGDPKTTARRFMSEAYWRQPLSWDRAAARDNIRRRVFCASMADVFEHHPSLDVPRERLWALVEETPQLDWLLLTKRPQNIARMLPATWLDQPRANVWLGTSAESQPWADRRIPRLLSVPAVVHFVSAEPLLGQINLGGYLARDRVNWVIGGGESGAGFRPMDMDWARDLRDQCQRAGVAYFHKQGAGRYPGQNQGLDGQLWQEFPQVCPEVMLI
jgi:protein gp37